MTRSAMTNPGPSARLLDPREATHPHRAARRAWRATVFLALVAALWFGFLELRGLYFPDEGRYAEIPREMVATGDWITPRLNAIPYFEKPPLQYWATAAVFAVGGEDEWTARLAPALAGFLAVLAIGATARRLYSRRAGWMAAALLASSCGYFLANQFVTLDVMLTSLLTCALCAFLLAQRDDASASATRRWMTCAWLACALAFLAKGAIALVLPGLAVAAYLVATRDIHLLGRLHPVRGLLLFALVVAPWLMAVEARNPGFLHFFFITEHWERFTQPSHQRTGPWWYFLPIGAVFLLPWLPALVTAIAARRGPRAHDSGRHFAPETFAACWAVAVVAFFSLSSSKLPPYILPALPAIALAAAPSLARRWSGTVRTTAWTLVASGAAGTALALAAGRWIEVGALREVYAATAGWMAGGMAVLAVTGVVALVLTRRRPVAALACLVVGGMLGCQVAAVTAHRIDAYFSAERLIEALSGGEARRPFHPEVPFYSVDLFDHTVPFYLGRPVTLVKERGELAWGIARAPATFIADIDTFAERWRNDDQAYAIMERATYESLAGAGLPMHVVGKDVRRVVVTRR